MMSQKKPFTVFKIKENICGEMLLWLTDLQISALTLFKYKSQVLEIPLKGAPYNYMNISKKTNACSKSAKMTDDSDDDSEQAVICWILSFLTREKVHYKLHFFQKIKNIVGAIPG